MQSEAGHHTPESSILENIESNKEALKVLREIDKTIPETGESYYYYKFKIAYFVNELADKQNIKIAFLEGGKKYVYKLGTQITNVEKALKVAKLDDNDKTKPEQILHSSIETEDWVFQINDVRKFIWLMKKFRELIAQPGKTRWIEGQDEYRIWSNATISDLLEPEEYLKRIIVEIKDVHWENISEWTKISEITDLSQPQTLWIKRSESHPEMESEHEIQTAISTDTPSNLDSLQSVRYGLSDVATIYAIQMPPIKDKTEKMIRKQNKEDRELATARRKQLNDFYLQNHDLFVQIVGEIPDWFVQLDDDVQYMNEFCKWLRNIAAKGNEKFFIYWAIENKTKLSEEVSNSENYRGLLALIDAIDLKSSVWHRILFEDDKRIAEFEERKKRTKQVNKLMSGAESPGAVVSLAIFIKMIHLTGLREIQVPSFYPQRQHIPEFEEVNDHYETYSDLDAKITEDKFLLLQRLTKEIEGISIIDEDDNLSGYFRVKLSDNLVPKKAWLQQVYHSLDNQKTTTAT